eukprot:UN1082
MQPTPHVRLPLLCFDVTLSRSMRNKLRESVGTGMPTMCSTPSRLNSGLNSPSSCENAERSRVVMTQHSSSDASAENSDTLDSCFDIESFNPLVHQVPSWNQQLCHDPGWSYSIPMTNVEHEPQVIALVTKPDRYIAAIFVEVALDDDSHILIDECKLRQGMPTCNPVSSHQVVDHAKSPSRWKLTLVPAVATCLAIIRIEQRREPPTQHPLEANKMQEHAQSVLVQCASGSITDYRKSFGQAQAGSGMSIKNEPDRRCIIIKIYLIRPCGRHRLQSAKQRSGNCQGPECRRCCHNALSAHVKCYSRGAAVAGRV